ncbi:MAG: ATP--guanido phosphotransferase [Oscillospiraceae bacterium]
MKKWYESDNKTPVVSTRIRLARNLNMIPFSTRISDDMRAETNDKIVAAIMSGPEALTGTLKCIDMDDISQTEALSMVERHMISPEFAQKRKNRKLVFSEDESVSIMLGEEDHIRIQVLKGDMQLNEAYDIADKIDTVLSEQLDIAFDKDLGYITECPTNLGTGLRASVMLHLPLLEALGEIPQLADSVSKIGLTIRGIYGESSGVKAAMYQLSNQVTLGIPEQSAIDNLKSITMQIIDREEQVRKQVDPIKLEDTIYRAYGILKNARLLSSEEMMENVSSLLLGVRSKVINLGNDCQPLKLMIETQPAMMMLEENENDAEKRDIKRAQIFRNALE